MTKKEKMMVVRTVMGAIGVLCMLFSINETFDIKSTTAENILAIVGFILCIPIYSSSICYLVREYKSIEKDEIKIKKIDAELKRLSK